MASRIEQLTLGRFRGATQPTTLHLDTNKPLVLIFGENGTGKTTIVDAIDLIANRSKGSISDRSSTGAADLASVGEQLSDVQVAISDGRTTWRANITKTQIQVDPAAPSLRASILRRGAVLNLVEATPSNRYKMLAPFLDVEAIENAEAELREAIKEVKNDLAIRNKQAASARQELLEIWQKEGSPQQTVEAWIATKTATEPTALREAYKTIDALAGALGLVKQTLASLSHSKDEITGKQAALEGLRSEIEKQPGNRGDELIALLGTLQKAQAFLASAPNTEQCPVCLQPISGEKLRAEIDQRLGEMQVLITLSNRKRTVEQELQTAVGLSERLALDFVVNVTKLTKLTVEAAIPGLAIVPTAHADTEALLSAKEPNLQLLEAANRVAPHLLALEASVLQRRHTTQNDLSQFDLLAQRQRRMIDGERQCRSLEQLQARLERAALIVAEQRKAYTDQLLDALSEEINRLYQVIHPDEVLGDLKLRLDPKQRASLLQQATFAGKHQVAPQGYFSESHLDTLGFCVWLAMAKRQDSADTILVIDDVFTSVDLPHLSRIMDLVFDESHHFAQVIVATHVRSVWERFRSAKGPSANVQRIQLHDWRHDRGIRHQDAPLEVDELEAELQKSGLNRRTVSAMAGAMLEAVLSALADRYRCSVPYKSAGDYTLSDWLSAWQTKKGSQLKIVRQVKAPDGSVSMENNDIEPLLAALRGDTYIRNQVGGHYNEAGMEISDTDVRLYAEKVLNLVKALTCADPTCRQLAQIPDQTHYRCRCRKHHMTPFQLT